MKAKYLLVLGLLASSWTQAEQGCAPGFSLNPNSTPGGPMCTPIPGYGTTNNPSQSQPLVPEPRWATRWGAIAIDDTNSGVGTAVGMRSKRKAEKAAMQECQAKGGDGCRIDLAYFNQCGVIAWGDTHYVTAGSATISEASELALNDCEKTSSNCRIYYADCSYAERVQ